MTYVLICALMGLTAAVVLLFAMIGVVGAGGFSAQRAPDFASIESPVIGRDCTSLLDDRFGRDDIQEILVLSSSCRSCSALVEDNAAFKGAVGDRTVGFIVSCPDTERGQSFADANLAFVDTGLVYIDPGGQLSTGHLGISSSPSLLRLRTGLALSAWQFGSLSTLGQLLG